MLNDFFKGLSSKIGSKPGHVIYVGEERSEKSNIEIIDYDGENYHEFKAESVEQCFPYKDSESRTWINLEGIHNVDIVEKLGLHFEIHPLSLEDIANTVLRPKIEETDKYTFISLKMLRLDGNSKIESEQVSIVFGSNFLISFQETEGDVFDPVRNRLKNTIPRVRFLGMDYLAYALIDSVVDGYFIVLEDIAERLEELEDNLVQNPQKSDLEKIHELKREMLYLRKTVKPLREVVLVFERIESPMIHDFTRMYIRDLYEHVMQVSDSVDTYREMVSGLLDIYLSSISNKMNEVMKVLTIIATIFIPLGFLAGVYGMNFNTESSVFNLPELDLKYGYPLFWLVALLIGGGLFIYFKRKDWL